MSQSAPRNASQSASAPKGPRLVLVDNYDSYTFNLFQYLGELGARVEVFRNDAITVEEIRQKAPDGVVLSPGPCTPREAGITVPVIEQLGGVLPILGVCLGHQAIGQAFGGKVIRNHRIVHGKASPVFHQGQGVLQGLPSPFQAGRYHSLVIERKSLPRALEVTGWTDEDEIMAVRHRTLDVEGVQFHPESILTEGGKALLGNWVQRLGGARTAPTRTRTAAARPKAGPARVAARNTAAGRRG